MKQKEPGTPAGTATDTPNIDWSKSQIYKRPGKLKRLWMALQELWHYRKCRFFIMRSKLSDDEYKGIKSITETAYYNGNDKLWYYNARQATTFTFFWSIVLCYALRKNKIAGYEFSMGECGNIMFVESVTKGPGVSKDDFR